MKRRLIIGLLILALIAVPLFAACGGEADPEDTALAFDAGGGETISVTLDGQPLDVTRYLVTYVAHPIEMAEDQPNYGPPGMEVEPTVHLDDVYVYQKMYIYVPATATDDQDTAIILQVYNGGWRTSAVSESITEGAEYVSTSDEDSIGAALKAGYIICSAGTRSRGAMAADGTWAGKSPAVVVDAKAAIRYLKLNDAVMPGSADFIVITGGSGGGGLSVAVGASGNSADYYPYLEEIGAAGIDASGDSTLTDDVFAVMAYCPITDLDHADIAYEWQYGAMRLLGDYTSGEPDMPLSQAMKDSSVALAAQYPAYLASLGLELEDGTPLTADTMPDAIMALVKSSVEEAMAQGQDVPALGEDWTLPGMSFFGPAPDIVVTNDWLDIDEATGTVVSMNYDKYLECVCNTAQLKTVPAFDATGTCGTAALSGENSLYGSEDIEYSNFMQWAWDNNELAGDNTGLDDTGQTWDEMIAGSELEAQLKMVNPMPYLIDDSEGDSAPYWYVRHGMRDRDTSFAIEVALFYAIENDPTVEDANYKLTYFKPHGGSDDVQEAYGWLAGVLAD